MRVWVSGVDSSKQSMTVQQIKEKLSEQKIGAGLIRSKKTSWTNEI